VVLHLPQGDVVRDVVRILTLCQEKHAAFQSPVACHAKHQRSALCRGVPPECVEAETFSPLQRGSSSPAADSPKDSSTYNLNSGFEGSPRLTALLQLLDRSGVSAAPLLSKGELLSTKVWSCDLM